MSTIADLLIKVRADTGPASKDISSFGSKVGRGFNKALLPATAGLAVLGVAAKSVFTGLQEGANIAAQTSQVIKTTGGAANVTASQVNTLAMSLRRKSGVDNDLIQSGANMLLTFTNVRNEVGKGNDIFNQATATVLDMSVALGQDTKSSAIQLGKALNDPIKGVSALQRVGVSFTADQKEQIKTLVASGDTMAAQKIILNELGKEFGGTAANADPLSIALNNLKLDVTDMAEGIITALLPAFKSLVGMLQVATGFLKEHQTATKVVIGVLAALAVGVIAVNAAMKVYVAGAAVVKAATAAWTAVQWLLNAALAANPIGIVVIALAGLATGLVVAYKKSETFREVVNGVFNAVKNVVLTAIGLILGAIDKYLGAIEGIARVASKLPLVGDKFKGVADAVAGAREKVQGLQSSIDGLKSKEIKITTTFASIYTREEKLPGNVIGARAAGGPVRGGMPYLVGEKGPEIFTPNTSGNIVPNHVAASGGIAANVGSISGDEPGDIVLELDGEVLARFNRRELTRKGRRNVGLSFS